MQVISFLTLCLLCLHISKILAQDSVDSDSLDNESSKTATFLTQEQEFQLSGNKNETEGTYCESYQHIRLSIITEMENNYSELKKKKKDLNDDLVQIQGKFLKTEEKNADLINQLEISKSIAMELEANIENQNSELKKIKMQKDDREKELIDDVLETGKSLENCRTNLIESESNFNIQLQRSNTLEDSMIILRREKDSQIRKLKDEIEELSKNLDHKTTQVTNLQGSNQDLRKQLSTSTLDLKNLQIESASQYCNLTHAKEDLKEFSNDMNKVMKQQINKAWRYTKKQYGSATVVIHSQIAPIWKRSKRELMKKISIWSKEIEPFFNEGKKKVDIFYLSQLDPYIRVTKSKIQEFYDIHTKSSVQNHTLPFYEKHAVELIILCQDAISGIRLSLVSGLKLFSSNAITYIQTLKEDEQKSNKAKKENKKSFESKIPHEKVVPILQTMEEKSDEIVDVFMKSTFVYFIFRRPLLCILRITFRVFSSIFAFFAFPWRYVVSSKKK